MDFLIYILIALVGALVVGLIGFAIPPALRKPHIEQEETLAPALAENLPAVVKRWLEASKLDATPGGDLAAWGLGKMAGPVLPVIGQIWMPLRWTLHLQPGEAFVWRAQITWFRWKFITGGDSLIDGQGIFDMSGKSLDGENMDASQFTPLWVYSLFLAPAVALQRPGLAWKDAQENSVTLQVPFHGVPYLENAVEEDAEEITQEEDDEAPAKAVSLPKSAPKPRLREFVLEFDPQTGHLRKLTTKRTTARKGDEQSFFVTFSGTVKEFPDGAAGSSFNLPEGVELGWDKYPYQRLNLKGLATGVSGVEKEIRRGIRA